MKLTTALALCFVVLMIATTARSQGTLDANITSLQKQIQVREAVDRDRRTAPDLRVLNRRVLETKRGELGAAVRLRIAQLQDYLAQTGNTSTSEQKQHVEASLRYLISIRDGAPSSTGSFVAQNPTPVSGTRSRIVGSDRAMQSSEQRRSAPASPAELKEPVITLESLQDGDTIIRGRSSLDISEVVVQIRTRDSATDASQPVGSLYSHSTQVRPQSDLIAYRVVRSAGFGNDQENWQFAVKLSRPLTRYQEVRALSGTEATQWAGVRGTASPAPALVKSDSPAQMTPVNQARDREYVPGRRGSRDLLYSDQCEGKSDLRQIRVYWDSGKVFPSRLKHSGRYCIEVIGANTVLYSYLIDVEAESPAGNPFDALTAAVGAIKDGFAGKTAAGNQVAGPGGPCELKAAVDDVKDKASKLQTALTEMMPKEENGKVKSVSLSDTVASFGSVRGRFADFRQAVQELRKLLNQPTAHCSVAERNEARDLVRDYDDVERRYDTLRARVDSPPPARVYEELEETDKTKITVREMFGHRQTTAETLTLNVAPGYALISASAGALMTQVPARSYHNRVAPDPANPTATQTILSVDYGGGTRPALTALLHYNLPFIQNRRLGMALSAGPVYDISGGKADTSKLGLFGGVSLRFSEWLYLTPGFHVGEFADFPEGFTRTGQVIPSNIAEPQPVKRYTTRFAFAITFKVKDLGQSGGSEAPAPGGK